MSNANPSPETRFKPGHPNYKLPGTKSKTTLLKEKLVDYALKLDLDDGTKITKRSGKKLLIIAMRSIPKVKILELAAGMVPREQLIKGEGFETNITLANVLGGGEIDPAARRELIACLRKGRSDSEST
jgi:hypothetical protein